MSVSTKSGKKIFPIGIGTWGLGGLMELDNRLDFDKQINAVAHCFKQGMNYVESVLAYADGKAVVLTAEALKNSGIDRADVFISQAIYTRNVTTIADAKNEVNIFAKAFDTDYVDTLQFTMSGFPQLGQQVVIDFMREMLQSGRTRYVSVTNANLELLVILHSEFGDQLFSHESHVSFEVRQNMDNGVLDYMKQNNILEVVPQPLRRNRTQAHNWPLLVELSKKYNCTQNQLIFAWMLANDWLPLFKSDSIEHIDENIASLDIRLEDKDVKRLNTFRLVGVEWPEVAWVKSGPGVAIDQFANIVDGLIEAQK
jgi:2,5-diketo-D-gluconate reductase B